MTIDTPSSHRPFALDSTEPRLASLPCAPSLTELARHLRACHSARPWAFSLLGARDRTLAYSNARAIARLLCSRAAPALLTALAP